MPKVNFVGEEWKFDKLVPHLWVIQIGYMGTGLGLKFVRKHV